MRRILHTLLLLSLCAITRAQQSPRTTVSFDKDWKFLLGDDSEASKEVYHDEGWRRLDLPHDWSIEGAFSKDNPAKPEGGGLPTGTGWYRKAFFVPLSSKFKQTSIEFDGVYRNSEVWINGHYLGKRPNGYISFRYNLTPYLTFGNRPNIIAVRVDNSAQPASRWYSGSGIYRHVWLVTTAPVAIDHWGTCITTPAVSHSSAVVRFEGVVRKVPGQPQRVSLETIIYKEDGREVQRSITPGVTLGDSVTSFTHQFKIDNPQLWSVARPYLYRAVTRIIQNGSVTDEYETPFGIRYFHFDPAKGFFLNGEHLKILGVCMHHDLGALGAAVNTRAMERQLQMLKSMGCNAIRTAHNPPAPELLDLCDRMGFIVMDEAFDMWVKKKNKADYHLDWDAWHRQDLTDQVLRDRNHPSVFIWSIGNEIREQFDSSGITIARELVGIIKSLDTTRLVTSALSENNPAKNYIYQSGALDIIGLNYHHEAYKDFPKNYPGQSFIGSENMSALASRGHYDMPSDKVRFWPKDGKEKFVKVNPDFTVSSYDNVAAYWGSTQETTWKIIKKYEYLSGLFIWTGFDYLGEPTPYPWPARSSYFGLVDLAGFPKDAYYLYQSEWTDKPVLHLFPHWNWKGGKTVDVWAYYNNADEVELFLNGKSLGIRKKKGDDLHVMWRVKYVPGTLRAVSRKNGEPVLTREISTAGKPARIRLIADRSRISADGRDLSFITVQVLDAAGNIVPDAANLVRFQVSGPGIIAGVDNGYPASLEPFKADYRKAYNGLCLAIIQSTEREGRITLRGSSEGLQGAEIAIESSK